MKRHWKAVFGRPRRFEGQLVFQVRLEHQRAVQQAVICACRRPRHGNWSFWFVLPLLDGTLDNLPYNSDGSVSEGEGWSVRGVRLARWVLYQLEAIQPERFLDEGPVPSRAELEEDILLEDILLTDEIQRNERPRKRNMDPVKVSNVAPSVLSPVVRNLQVAHALEGVDSQKRFSALLDLAADWAERDAVIAWDACFAAITILPLRTGDNLSALTRVLRCAQDYSGQVTVARRTHLLDASLELHERFYRDASTDIRNNSNDALWRLIAPLPLEEAVRYGLPLSHRGPKRSVWAPLSRRLDRAEPATVAGILDKHLTTHPTAGQTFIKDYAARMPEEYGAPLLHHLITVTTAQSKIASIAEISLERLPTESGLNLLEAVVVLLLNKWRHASGANRTVNESSRQWYENCLVEVLTAARGAAVKFGGLPQERLIGFLQKFSPLLDATFQPRRWPLLGGKPSLIALLSAVVGAMPQYPGTVACECLLRLVQERDTAQERENIMLELLPPLARGCPSRAVEVAEHLAQAGNISPVGLRILAVDISAVLVAEADLPATLYEEYLTRCRALVLSQPLEPPALQTLGFSRSRALASLTTIAAQGASRLDRDAASATLLRFSWDTLTQVSETADCQVALKAFVQEMAQAPTAQREEYFQSALRVAEKFPTGDLRLKLRRYVLGVQARIAKQEAENHRSLQEREQHILKEGSTAAGKTDADHGELTSQNTNQNTNQNANQNTNSSEQSKTPEKPGLAWSHILEQRSSSQPRNRNHYTFAVRPGHEKAVKEVCNQLAYSHEVESSSFATRRTYKILDGQMRHVSGAPVLLRGPEAVRLLLYRLGASQPPKMLDEGAILSWAELEQKSVQQRDEKGETSGVNS